MGGAKTIYKMSAAKKENESKKKAKLTAAAEDDAIAGFTIEQLQEKDVSAFYELPKGEQWNPGFENAVINEIFDPKDKQILVGKINNQVMGSISCCRYGDYGWIGVYIIKKEFRGKGLGIQLWNQAMERLSGCKVIGLDGVEARFLCGGKHLIN